MKERRYLQLDVFADRPGAGNPLAVVVDTDGLDTPSMQAFARWTNLSETIFLLPPRPGADYRVRIFTPRQELPFAGHPSVGAAWAVIEMGLVDPGRRTLVQDCGAGHLPVRIGADRRVTVRAPAAQRIAKLGDRAALLDTALAGSPRTALDVALWRNGPDWWVVELNDEAAVRKLRPDFAAIEALTGDSSSGLIVFAPARGEAYDVVVRAFCPADGVPEDPVCGSGNAAVAAALVASGRLAPGDSHCASQGREVGRDGRVHVHVDSEGEVWIGGAVQAVIRGTVAW